MRSKILFYLGLLLMLLSLGACSDSTQGQQEQQTQQEKRETQQEQGKEQSERTDVIERTVVKTVEAPKETADEQPPPATQKEPAPEEQAPEETLALQYQYINEGNYATAYSLFNEESQQFVSLEQYTAFFESLGFYQVTDYSFPSVEVQGNEAIINTVYTVSSSSGEEQYQRTQKMQLTDGNWRAVMRDDQVQTFIGTSSEPAPDVQQPESANTKQVTVEVYSDVPADVSIIDDNFDANIAEEIVGSETYELEVAADSGLLVDASSEDLMTGNISIAVYENGELIAEDNSSEGYAQVIY